MSETVGNAGKRPGEPDSGDVWASVTDRIDPPFDKDTYGRHSEAAIPEDRRVRVSDLSDTNTWSGAEAVDSRSQPAPGRPAAEKRGGFGVYAGTAAALAVAGLAALASVRGSTRARVDETNPAGEYEPPAQEKPRRSGLLRKAATGIAKIAILRKVLGRGRGDRDDRGDRFRPRQEFSRTYTEYQEAPSDKRRSNAYLKWLAANEVAGRWNDRRQQQKMQRYRNHPKYVNGTWDDAYITRRAERRNATLPIALLTGVLAARLTVDPGDVYDGNSWLWFLPPKVTDQGWDEYGTWLGNTSDLNQGDGSGLDRNWSNRSDMWNDDPTVAHTDMAYDSWRPDWLPEWWDGDGYSAPNFMHEGGSIITEDPGTAGIVAGGVEPDVNGGLPDGDGDGIPDVYDGNDGGLDGGVVDPDLPDNDNDGIPDVYDGSDVDGAPGDPDTELNDDDGDGIPNVYDGQDNSETEPVPPVVVEPAPDPDPTPEVPDGGTVPPVAGTPEANDAMAAETFAVESGNGVIVELDQLAERIHGHALDNSVAERIYFDLPENVRSNIIDLPDHSGPDMYAGPTAGDYRISAPGAATWNPAVRETVVDHIERAAA